MEFFKITKHDITEPIVIRQEPNDPRESETMRVWHSCLLFGKRLISKKGYTPDQMLTHVASQVGTKWDDGFFYTLAIEFEKAHINWVNRDNPNWV